MGHRKVHIPIGDTKFQAVTGTASPLAEAPSKQVRSQDILRTQQTNKPQVTSTQLTQVRSRFRVFVLN